MIFQGNLKISKLIAYPKNPNESKINPNDIPMNLKWTKINLSQMNFD